MVVDLTNNPDMPIQTSLNNDKILFGIKLLSDGRNGLVSDSLLYLLPLPIARVQFKRLLLRRFHV